MLHPYLHYIYARERQRDFHRIAARYHLITLARAGKPAPKGRVTIWLADRLIAAGEQLKRRYAPPTRAAHQVFTPLMDVANSTLDHNGRGSDRVV
jgi:hypothetical protein